MRRYLANRETLIAESINEFLEVIDRENVHVFLDFTLIWMIMSSSGGLLAIVWMTYM